MKPVNELFSIFPNQQIQKLSDKTSKPRDRYVDFLRALSILVVVFGHWLSTVVYYNNGRLVVHNVVGIVSGLWILTWILQVMPVFFFVGGFSNYVSYTSALRRNQGTKDFYRSRTTRLLKPAVVFVVVWLIVSIILYFANQGHTEFVTKNMLLFGPLWFLVVYIIIVLTTPFMQPLHLRYRYKVLILLFLLTILVDACRFWLNLTYVSYLNILFVWLLVHQLGFFYADGTLVRMSKRTHVLMALIGLAGLAILTNLGIYPRSMVGTGLEKVSNMSPPTICIIVLTLWLVGLAMLLRDAINRWLDKPKPWLAVISANSIIMTIYLWHLTAFFITFLLLNKIGLSRAPAGTSGWWLERPLWIILSAIILVVLIKLFGRFEHGFGKVQTGQQETGGNIN
jgi:peptidoglycan/LPS O-acetylase OafA/YrhL